MKILGFEVTRAKAAVGATAIPASALDSGSWWRSIGESFSGAWQRNIVVESSKNILAFSAVYSCVSMISYDIAKLRLRLIQLEASGVWAEVIAQSPFKKVLRKPNSYQTRIQFIRYWVICKLLHGNVYILKERQDRRGIVTALHVLDPRLVKLLVTEDGGVYYQLNKDSLSRGTEDFVIIPASEIIHDRGATLWHPLIGVSPIYACGASATQGIRIQNNSALFFENMSRPSGQLTAPGEITEANAKRLKEEFEKNFGGGNIGRLLVTGDGLKYEPLAMPANDAQLIEQLRWTVEDVARAFGVPLHKLGTGDNPTFTNFGAINQDYFNQTLQGLIEDIELLLEEGLDVNNDTVVPYGVEFDTGGLLRMDPGARADASSKKVQAGIMAPNEARLDENLPPAVGGDTPYLQQQNWSLRDLNERSKLGIAGFLPAPKPAATPAPADPSPQDPSEDGAKAVAAARRLTDALVAKFATEQIT